MPWSLPTDLAPWAQHVEATYIAATLARATPPPWPAAGFDGAALEAIACGCACAVAARFLAVGKPRSLGIISDDPQRAAALLAGHHVWHRPTDVRWAGAITEDRELVASGGRVVAMAEALTADIVCFDVEQTLHSAAVRRGSHLNVLAGRAEAELQARAVCIGELAAAGIATTLGELAAGIRDGRQLDEITLLLAADPAHGGALALARRAVGF